MASPSLRNQPNSGDQRNVIIATVLVAIVTFVWMLWLGPQPNEVPDKEVTAADTQQVDTATPAPSGPDSADLAAAPPEEDTQAQDTSQTPAVSPADPTIAGAEEGDARTIVVENELYRATFTTRGATITSFILKDYLKFDQEELVELVDSTNQGALSLAFTTPSSRLIDTRDFTFDADFEGDTLRVTDEPVTLTFSTPVGEGALRQTYTFKPESYDVDLAVTQTNASAFSTNDGYEVMWEGGLPYSEGGTETERTHSGAYAYSGGELESITLQSEEAHDEKRLNGDVSWTAVKNKYFTAVVLPGDPSQVLGAELIGDAVAREANEADFKSFVTRLQMPSPTSAEQTDRFNLYMGPVYYNNLAPYDRDLYDMVDYGWDFFEWVTRPLAKFVFIPIMTFFGQILPNYGFVVILLAILVKTAVYPLTKSSYRSMAQMRELQPRMQELKEEYADDPQKQQEEMMKMYRETGVNPLGGCLPMFLQYPILIALYQFIPQSIQLRQESFLWAHDLSVPDRILELPFNIPIYGDYVSGFTLLMGLAMLVQMRLQSTPDAGGQAKVMMYAMPAFIFFIFNQFAAALSLYYLIYNIMSAIQQKWINMQLEKEKEEDATTPNNKKGSKSKKARGNGRSNATGGDGASGDSWIERLRRRVEEG